MREITSDYIFLGNGSVLKNGTIGVDDQGVIRNISKERKDDAEYFKGAICPGFINVHCHTELSYAKGLITEQSGIDTFIHELEKLKRTVSEEEKQNAIKDALNEMHQEGTVAVGDIINTTDSILSKKQSPIEFYNFVETYGSQAKDAENAWYKALGLYGELSGYRNIVPHAPYSLSRTLFQKVRDFQKPNTTLSMHHMESEGEAQYFVEGTGLLADRFRSWGLERPPHIPTKKRPLNYLAEFFMGTGRLLLIHNTFITKEDIEYANTHLGNVYYGLCPNANLYIENEKPPVSLLFESGANICIGTDSLASNHQLSILDELKTIEGSNQIKTEELIKWATLNGALALGMEANKGSIEYGKKPGLVHLRGFDFKNDNPLSNTEAHLIVG